MNLTELRDVVRSQTQTTAPELPDPLIDVYLQQGFERTINGEVLWPFYETSWDITFDPDQSVATLPGDVNQSGVMALYDLTNNFRLTQIAPEFGDDHYVGASAGTTAAVQFSLWADQVWLWPRAFTHVDPIVYRLRGYRKPLVWLNSANEPDCDPRFHLCFTHYAVALAYEQQEDETLNTTYMDRWQRDAEMAHKAIMAPRHQRPLVLSGSIDTVPAGGASWVLVPPAP